MTVADRVKQRREQLGWSQDDLAKKLGLKSRSSITRIEKSGDDISLKDVTRLSKALDCSVLYLMDWEHLKPGEAIFSSREEFEEIDNIFSGTFEKKRVDDQAKRLMAYYTALKDKQALLDYAEYLSEKERRESK